MGRKRQEARFRDLAKAVACECMPGIVRKVMREVVREEVGAAADRIIDALRPKEPQPAYQYTQAQVAEYLSEACRLKGLPKRYALSRRTIQRMESGEAPQRAGYTAAVRLNQASLFAWIRDYVQGVLTQLNPDKVVSFDENLLAHQVQA